MELKMMAARFAAKAIVLVALALLVMAGLSMSGCGASAQDATPADAETVTAEETVETLTMDDGSEIVVDSEGNVVSTSGGAAAEYVASHGSSGVSATKVQADTGKQVSTATATRPVTRPSTGGAPVTSGGQTGTPQAPAQTQPSQPQAPAQVACAHDWQARYRTETYEAAAAYDDERKVKVGEQHQCSCGATFESHSELAGHQNAQYAVNGTFAGHGASRVIPKYETQTVHHDAVMAEREVFDCYVCSKCGATK